MQISLSQTNAIDSIPLQELSGPLGANAGPKHILFFCGPLGANAGPKHIQTRAAHAHTYAHTHVHPCTHTCLLPTLLRLVPADRPVSIDMCTHICIEMPNTVLRFCARVRCRMFKIWQRQACERQQQLSFCDLFFFVGNGRQSKAARLCTCRYTYLHACL